ncbi:MAG: archaeal flagellar protein FlaI [Archaeoglobaceae archaeon]|nr:archaeal flagellar protein FlaI [Archaeoglobaceae archaeon]
MARFPIALIKKEAKEERKESEKLDPFEEEALEKIRKAKKEKEILKTRREAGLLKREKVKEYRIEELGALIEFTPPEGWRVAEEYWVKEPYCKVYILHNDEEQDYLYFVAEPRFNPYELEVYGQIFLIIREELEKLEIQDGIEREEVLKETYTRVLRELKLDLDDKSHYKILYYLFRDLLGYGKISAFMSDRMLEDIRDQPCAEVWEASEHCGADGGCHDA